MIEEQNFNLKSISRLKAIGFHVIWNTTVQGESEVISVEGSEKKDQLPAPALLDTFNKLKSYLVESIHIPEDKACFAIVKKVVVSHVEDKGEKFRAVKIVGTIQVKDGEHVNISSPIISLRESIFGFEEDLGTDIQIIEAEACKYVQGTYAQKSLFDQAAE